MGDTFIEFVLKNAYEQIVYTTHQPLFTNNNNTTTPSSSSKNHHLPTNSDGGIVLRMLKKETDTQIFEKTNIILAPTHRSLLDFLVLSYMTFALPELQIDIPKIAAADDFSRLPVFGWLSYFAGAFFIVRGKNKI